jgi:hypothetical protein
VTLGLKYKLVTLTFGEARRHLISDALAESVHQFLTRTLSARMLSMCLKLLSSHLEGGSRLDSFDLLLKSRWPAN